MLKLFIADDHPVIREGLKQIIARTRDMMVVGEAADGQEVLEKVQRIHPDILILDISMPGRNGLEILKQLKLHSPKIAVLILSQYPEDHYALRVLRAGASGYLTKESASEELIKALRKVADGGVYISSLLAETLASQMTINGSNKPHETLSDREYEVLCMLGAGKTVTEIGEELSLSVKTISTYRARIGEKMRIEKTADLIRYVIENQLIGPEPKKQKSRR